MTNTCLARLDVVNRAINAVVRVLAEDTLAAADATDKARAQGDILDPLQGVPWRPKEANQTLGFL